MVMADYSFIWSSKASRASTNLSTTTSHRSMRSSKPFSSASTAVVPSRKCCQLCSCSVAVVLTVGLDSDVHKCFGGMGY
jgi:hypothetical protein